MNPNPFSARKILIVPVIVRSCLSSARRFKEWGIAGTDINRGVFESRAPPSLGSHRQERPLFVVGAAGDTTFGGVRIDGLISRVLQAPHVDDRF
jgi:hypothetical protein